MGKCDLRSASVRLFGVGFAAGVAAGCALAEDATLPIGATPTVFEAFSTTARAITGDIEMSTGAIVFANGAEVALAPVATLPAADWLSGFGAAAGPVQLFRMADDPGALLNGNTLCGRGAATYLAAQWITAGDLRDLLLAVHAGAAPPSTADGPGLCGTFTYGGPTG